MKRLFFVIIGLCGCFLAPGAVNRGVPPLSDLTKDFAVTEHLELKLFKEYEYLHNGAIHIEKSVLWNIKKGSRNFGACYDLATGKKLSVIATKGVAPYQLSRLDRSCMADDVILLWPDRETIKVVYKADILNNVPEEKRRVVEVKLPKDVLVSSVTRLPNGSFLATIHSPVMEFERGKREDINKSSVVLFEGEKIRTYETIDYGSFELRPPREMELKADELVKWSYAQGLIKTKGNDMAVFSVYNQFILYILDLNSGEVVREKRYTKMSRVEEMDEQDVALVSTNDREIRIKDMVTTDRYVICLVTGYLTPQDKQLKQGKEAVFVFDWDLKPVKKIELPVCEYPMRYFLSKDGRSVCRCLYSEDGMALYKADLKL